MNSLLLATKVGSIKPSSPNLSVQHCSLRLSVTCNVLAFAHQESSATPVERSPQHTQPVLFPWKKPSSPRITVAM